MALLLRMAYRSNALSFFMENAELTLILVMPPQPGLLNGFATGLISIANYVQAQLPSIRVQLLDLSDAPLSALEATILNAESLNSASHGAGRAMSRKAANEKFNWKDVNRLLRERGVTLISSGLDEVPMAYKNIREVMEAQRDLVTVLGQFDPKLVKMSPAGERPED